jgi:microcystin-dependent protein
MRRCALLLVLVVGLAMVPCASAQERFLGSISLVGYNFPQQGTAFCDGQLLSIAQNTALFSLLGTTYGGDGRTTFALPDLRGRVAIAMGQGPGLSLRNEGDRGGEETVTLTVSQLPPHSHNALASTTVGNTVSPLNNHWATGPRVLLYSASAPNMQMSSGAVGSTGGSQPHDNLKPYLGLNYEIWLVGIFPSRN